MCRCVCCGLCYEKLSQNEVGSHKGDGGWKSLEAETRDCLRVHFICPISHQQAGHRLRGQQEECRSLLITHAYLLLLPFSLSLWQNSSPWSVSERCSTLIFFPWNWGSFSTFQLLYVGEFGKSGGSCCPWRGPGMERESWVYHCLVFKANKTPKMMECWQGQMTSGSSRSPSRKCLCGSAISS